ncbi:Wadjet anti-phage system protein JetD domain-containing protein [Rhodoferax mekongensis]|uniref:DUF2220 family protein n=1 Tax=Rhodoferax mekongensis TaxID=3068341 RepID=A0ABZ0AWC5_9BURK|nr:Wadjet anti-phage system protein JetD domain-containing protein [Rhodoferax sp. TBRC 17307]WNO03945.1 DUF2220 family protein [Rhodoferax sp. TBRC 17307]
MMDFPWLHSPAIQQLLHKLVDKLDAAEGRGSASPLALSLNEASWPALYKANFESEKETLWEQVLQLQRAGWIQISPAQATKSSQGYDANPKIKCVNVDAIRLATSRLERPKTAIERWRSIINEHLDASDEAKLAAGNYCIDLADHPMVDVVQQLNRLKDLQAEPLMLREVSAKLFWGMSKILDSRTGLVNAILGTDECPFPETPVQLQVFLPKGGFNAVLFIENQLSFERAIRSDNKNFSKLALIYASGFKGSAVRLREVNTASIYLSTLGEKTPLSLEFFESWLFGKNMQVESYFWGDLDWSGIRILASLRTSFPDLKAWTAGYDELLKLQNMGDGHSPGESNKLGQRRIESTGCLYTDTILIPALTQKQSFVDQEAIQF